MSGDLLEFSKINSDPEVMRYFPSILDGSETLAMIKKFQEHFEFHGYTYFATDLLDTCEFLGFIGLFYQNYTAPFNPATDIGWRLKRSAWGKGYATEGAKRCLDNAFEDLNLEKVVSVCPRKNRASENVMKKIGMEKKGEFDHPKLLSSPELSRCLWYEKKNY